MDSAAASRRLNAITLVKQFGGVFFSEMIRLWVQIKSLLMGLFLMGCSPGDFEISRGKTAH